MAKGHKYKRNNRVKRTENNVILIVCCGETEEKYFKAFNLDLGEVKVKAITKPQSPTLMVKHAKKLSKEQNYIQVWCVFDKDEFTDFNDAISKADNEGIKVAYSNQAFEYWFILHYENSKGYINRKDYSKILEKHMKNPYHKAEDNIYEELRDKIDFAAGNAKVIHQTFKKEGGQPSEWESCTTVYKLVKELEKWRK